VSEFTSLLWKTTKKLLLWQTNWQYLIRKTLRSHCPVLSCKKLPRLCCTCFNYISISSQQKFMPCHWNLICPSLTVSQDTWCSRNGARQLSCSLQHCIRWPPRAGLTTARRICYSSPCLPQPLYSHQEYCMNMSVIPSNVINIWCIGFWWRER